MPSKHWEEAAWQFRGNDEAARRRAETMAGVVASARKRLPDLPREEAARAERMFVRLDVELSPPRAEQSQRLTRFIEQYRGTEAALLAEVDVITSGAVSQQMFDSLDAFIAAHPGTNAAAKALYMKGFQWHTINTLGSARTARRRSDRSLHARSAHRRGAGGWQVSQSEWVEKAPSLIVQFFMPEDAKIAPENLDRLIEAQRQFVRTHFELDDVWPDRNGVGYLITSKMADLFARKGDRIAGVEQLLDELERTAPDPAAVRYLRALFYMQPDRRGTKADAAMLEKARQVLTALSANGAGLYQRKALATVAAMTFADGDYTRARELFRKYATAYPQSSWTWVALVRVGQCEDGLGNPKAAAAAYLEAARKHSDVPPARVLGEEYTSASL